jgi:hypothetical protein
MRELDLYRKHLSSINGFDSKGCHKVAEEFCQDDLNALYVVTISFHKRQQASQLKATQLQQIARWFQSDELDNALSSLDAEQVGAIYTAIDKKRGSK